MITEGIFGVLTGLVGTAATSYFNLTTQKVKNAHDIAMIEAQTRAMIAEKDANIRVSEVELAGEVERLDAQIYAQSVKEGNKTNLSSKTLSKLFDSKATAWIGSVLTFLLGLVDVLKSGIRPVLTIYLVLLTSWLTFQASDLLQLKQALVTAVDATTIFTDMTNVIFYLTVSVVTWWFGDRRVAKFLYRLNDGNAQDK